MVNYYLKYIKMEQNLPPFYNKDSFLPYSFRNSW